MTDPAPAAPDLDGDPTPRATVDLDAAGLAFRLRRTVRGEVRFDPASRALYATDASHYRREPLGVVLPSDSEDVVAALGVCRDAGVAVTVRGGGTSLAGQAIGPGVVLDLSRHLRHGIAIDEEQRVAHVDPGVVLVDLQRAAAAYGLMFGPDPSTQNRCTIGGMIGNDACGVHSVSSGRTSDNVDALDVVLYDGTRFTAHEVGEASLRDADAVDPVARDVLSGLARLRDDHAAVIRERFPALPRRVSGYALDRLLPEQGFHVARSLVGTEGTCAVVLGATVRLIERPAARTLVVLGYPSLIAAAEDVPAVLATEPIGLEGVDDEVVAGARRRPGGVGAGLLPDGSAWLLVEYGGATPAEASSRADWLRSALRGAGSGPTVTVLDEPRQRAAVWAVRSNSLGATSFPTDGAPRVAGWEDAAVPPERVGDYLRGLSALLESAGLRAALYGHLGDGCVHAKISFDHATAAGAGRYRAFVEQAADLTVSLGGSLSGEHGDGRSRSELLTRMYGEDVVALFGAFKATWDPDGMLNPGIIVAPAALDDDLRARRRVIAPATRFTYDHLGGSFTEAVDRCVGVGACRRDDDAGTMCPSYRVTHEEQHSTRGRTRLLAEMVRTDSSLGGWRDTSIRDALELCLSCKACASECPTGVDVATYKAEFLYHHYKGRLRPRADLVMGLVPWWSRVASRWPGAANAVLGSRLARRLAGITRERPAPHVAPESLRAWWRRREAAIPATPGRRVVLFPDTFTDRFEPWVGAAAVAVLEDAGFTVEIPGGSLCCGRPLYDTGMLTLAQRLLQRLVRAVGDDDAPIVVLEPSCLAALRDELPRLLDSPEAAVVSRRAVSLSEALLAVDYQPPAVSRDVVVQPHCQHAAVVGSAADEALLARAGVGARVLDVGCCGMAGSFGFKAGARFETSVAIAESRYLPALRDLDDGTVVLADSFSCRTQTQDLAGRRPQHLAELLAAGLPPT